jgi:bacterial/archaeal transporter family-2 protein
VKELTYAICLLAGAVIAVQALINARLGQALGSGMHAVVVSFVIGTVGAVVYCAVQSNPVASVEAVRGGPWWMWTGGLLGVAFVWSTIFAVPKIGVSVLLPLVVAGQMTAAIVLEHFGLFGSSVQPISWARVGGVLLVVLGAVVLGVTRTPPPVD